MSDIKDRLAASLKYDAINGDVYERAVVASQIKEAIAALAEKDKTIKAQAEYNTLELARIAQLQDQIAALQARIEELEASICVPCGASVCDVIANHRAAKQRIKELLSLVDGVTAVVELWKMNTREIPSQQEWADKWLASAKAALGG
jgi:hypothetical protein